LCAGVLFLALQLRRLQESGAALAAGDLDAKVDTKHMYWDFRRHGENLNAISQGMGIAVEKQLKSERLKTELITNVSHDIKTPLTSIINYVDLLRRDHTPEQQEEYLSVLDRQSRKLKKLTEDLVEVSKASTGNLPVNASRRSISELLSQALGEYSEKLEGAQLEPVLSLPQHDLFACVDGTLMWRVLDNLFSNACKYAQSGTRLYIDAQERDGQVCLAFKNISRERLNIPADELLERFVRGDSARSTEGSGLGLNIARSLTELQGGTFSLSIDGDLFKVELMLPQAA
ncbi:MAG: sensor histidine kinase, partial [Oscillospiraceae bacterium]|nr:sensor histidine kinase [Oscillospiraceae bacterium]